jgi:hypothetical protein
MTDVKRWVADGASEPVQRLIAAARDEQPGEAGMQRTLVALGVGSAVVTGASHAAGGAGAATLAKGATGASTLALVTKWSAIGAVGAMTTFGAVEVTTHAFTPAAPPAAAVAASPKASSVRATPPAATVSPIDPEDTTEVDPADPEPADTAQATAPAVRTAPSGAADRTPVEHAESAAASERILEEVRAIDRARSALARGDGRGTIDALDGYRSGFSERRFEPEALYLRMEALARLGDAAGAKAAAQRLLTSFPNAPQAARARVVAGR